MARAAADLGILQRTEGLLKAIGPVDGARIIDIGCGEGVMARALAEQGATVTGYDPFIAETSRIAVGRGSYRLAKASADRIPEPDGVADVVLFVFSLHHVPEPSLATALQEARRLLRPSGRLCVAEPLPEGPGHYVMQPFHDETQVRQAATDALAAHAAPTFTNEQVLYFSERRSYLDFQAYAAQAIGGTRFNGYTEADVLSPEVRRRFDEMLALNGGDFDQRVRINLFA